jgi:hypothetical protein
VVLYGDGHYDYRNLRNASLRNPLPNHVPPFNWDDELNNNFANNPMSTDDFFAVLDGGEYWTNGLLDVSLGRLPIQSREEGQAYLDKVKLYEDPKSGGDWRGRITLTADDHIQRGAPNNLDQVPGHTNDSEELGGAALSRESGMRFDKIYELDYPFNASYLKPEATQDLLNSLNRGTLFVSYFGHGAFNQWSDEVLLQTNDALSRLRNSGKNFMVGVFSCTVGRFEKILDEGMCEQFVKQKEFGAISGLCGTRETYPSPNKDLGKLAVSRILHVENGQSPTLGDAVLFAKNSLDNGFQLNKQKYALFGEPVVMIRRPALQMNLEQWPDTLRALECGGLKGRVEGGSGNGSVNIRIVSGDIKKSYPLNEQFGVPDQSADKRGQILFERTVAYKNHAFSTEYFIPKQVPFGDTTAKIQLFAWDAEKPMEISHAVTGLSIQGTAVGGACAVDKDGRGPRISVTGCNVKESGEIDFPDRVKISLPYCLQIEVRDSTGGVMPGEGPDEGTTVELVGVKEPFHPQPGVDDLYRKTYQMTLQRNEMAPGEYMLKVSARDGFGNLGARQLRLQVSDDSTLRFVKAFNAPNPVKRAGTTFYFSTTLPVEEGEALVAPRVDRVRFDLRIFNQSGHMVQEFRNVLSGEVRWDGRDAWGRSLANGVYFYQVTARWDESQGSPGGAQKSSLRNILVLSR